MTLVLKPKEIYEKRLNEGRLGAIAIADGWKTEPLGDLIEILNGAPFDSNLFNRDGRGKPLIRIRDVGKVDTETWFSGEFDDKYLISPGDVLVGLDGDFRVAEWHGTQALLNQRVCKLLPKEDRLNKRFMLYHLAGWLDAIWEETSATTVKHLSSKTIQEIPFPVPSIEEQKRIVEVLDDYLSKLDKALAELHEAEHNIELLIESYRHDVVSGVYSQGIEGWRHTRLGEIARWGSGGTPQSGNPKYYGGTIPWCVIGDLTESDVILTEKSITDEGLAASSAKIVQPGTVLLAMYGASIGRTGLAATPMATNQAIAFAVPNSEVDPRYLLLFLQSQKRKFVHAGKGGAQPNISQTIIKDWSITFPPVEEQLRLIQQVNEHQQSMTVMMEENYRMKNQVLLLKKSLLNAAFTGELKV